MDTKDINLEIITVKSLAYQMVNEVNNPEPYHKHSNLDLPGINIPEELQITDSDQTTAFTSQ